MEHYLILLTVGLLAEHAEKHGPLHTFGVIDVVVGVIGLVVIGVVLLLSAFSSD